MFSPKKRKLILTLILVAFIFVSFNVVLFRPKKAEAFDTGISGFIVTAYEKISKIVEKIHAQIVFTAITNTLNMVSKQVAYKVATDLASGGQGGKPLFYTRPVSEYIKEAGESAAGNFIGEISQQEDLKNLGLDLCNPSFSVKLSLSGLLIKGEQPPEPKCQWKDVSKNWNEFISKMQGGGWENYVSASFDPSQNDFGAFITLNNRKEELKAVEEVGAQIDRITSAFESKKDTAGNIKTPYYTVEEINNFPLESIKMTALAENIGMYMNKNLLAPFANTFFNTITSKLLERWLKQGQWTLAGNQSGGGGGGGTGNSQYFSGGYTQAQTAALYADLLTANISSIANYQLLEDFITCGSGDQAIGNSLNNCVLSQNFYNAITNDPPITVQEAINTGLLSGDLLLIGPTDTRNKDISFCWQNALCYGNLQKLREARIIPLGWEIAASKVESGNDTNLQEVINNFNTETSAWYHLIDPNWVLKAPLTECKANVYSPILESAQSSGRMQDCVDISSCIKEKNDGSCETGAYGYCTKEKNIWRLGGTECDEQYNTCETLTKTSDNSVSSLVKASLESCDQNSSGCQWYSTSSQKVLVQENGVWQWQWQWQSGGANRLYLNDKAKECESSDAGCGKFIRAAAGTNLIYNGNFEIASSTNPLYPDGWDSVTISGSNAWNQSLGQGLNGSRTAMNSGGNYPDNYMLQPSLNPNNLVKLYPNEYYTVSVWAKALDSQNRPILRIANYGDSSVGSLVSYSGGTMIIPSGMTMSSSTSYSLAADLSAQAPNQDGWHFLSITILTNPNLTAPFSARVSGYNETQGQSSWFDNFQLEKTNVPSSYYDYGTVNLAYLKQAPDYLKCNGYTQTLSNQNYNSSSTCQNAGYFWRSDIQSCVLSGDASCAGYALSCQADQVGCQKYTPANGDPSLPGVAKPNDYCPAECSGYQSYIQEQNSFDALEGIIATSTEKYFIASTAKSCGANDLNCEEFTNLDKVAQGGEGKEYYSYVRQCVLPTNNTPLHPVESYYTWEGSDTTGYQLITWSLLRSNIDFGPCTNVGLNVQADNTTCIDSLDPLNSHHQQICTVSDLATNPDCRQFYDESGNAYYRLQERTITSSEDCHPLRRTATSGLYNAIPSEGRTCGAEVAGCSLYRGNSASNVRLAFTDNFEDGSTTGWSNAIISNESVYKNGHSAKAYGLLQTTVNPSIMAGNIISGKKYELVLVIKKITNGTTTINPSLDSNNNFTYFGQTVVTDDWQQLTLGPVTLDHAVSSSTERLMIGAGIYVDNIILKELNDNQYLVRDSWQTPLSCDNPIDNPTGLVGNTSGNRTYIGAMLGCQDYTDSNNNKVYLHSLTSLCSEELVGCELMINTYNSNSPYAQSFNLQNNNGTATSTYDDIKIPQDNFTYLVNDENKSCSAANKGCQTLGDPIINRSTESATTAYTVQGYGPNVYKINDPDNYSNILCANEQLFCQEYSGTGGSKYYFFDPGTKLCEYQQNKTVGNTTITGWFRQGTTTACYLGNASDSYQLYESTDNNYQGWVGTCPAEQSGCTEFVDPYSTSGDNLAANPGFEYDYDHNSSPDYYTSVGNPLISYDSIATLGVGQTRAVKTVYSSSTPVNKFGQGVTLQVGKSYHVSIKAKHGDNVGEGKLVVSNCNSNAQLTSPDNKFIINNNTASLTFNTDPVQPYTYNEYGGQIAADITAVCQVYFGSTGGTGLYFDDFTFKEIEPYYFINDDKLDKSSCGNQVSVSQGCVLFQDTTSPNMSFNSEASYQASLAQNYNLVGPTNCETGSAGCDSNMVLKVIRDRSCAEWYACVSSINVYNKNTNSYEKKCTQLGLCSEYSPDSSTGQCSNWVSSDNPVKLDDDLYTARNVGFDGRDYSGYSIYDKYSLSTMIPLDFAPPTNTALTTHDYRLVSIVGDKPNQAQCENLGVDLGLYPAINPLNASLIPVFLNGHCTLGIDGVGLHCSIIDAAPSDCDPSSVNPYTNQNYKLGDCCGAYCVGKCEIGEKVLPRGYASQDSPYPYKSWGTPGNTNQYFSGANICIETEEAFQNMYPNLYTDYTYTLVPTYSYTRILDGSGSCANYYKKVEYGNGSLVLYFADGITPPEKIYEVSDLNKASDDGGNIVYTKTKVTDNLNWGGYCVENNTGRVINGDPEELACNAWLPIDEAGGIADLGNQFLMAGYQPQAENEYMCLQAKGNYKSSGLRGTSGYVVDTRNVCEELGLFDCESSTDPLVACEYSFMQGGCKFIFTDHFSNGPRSANIHENNLKKLDISKIDLSVKAAAYDWPCGGNPGTGVCPGDGTHAPYELGGTNPNYYSENTWYAGAGYGADQWEMIWWSGPGAPTTYDQACNQWGIYCPYDGSIDYWAIKANFDSQDNFTGFSYCTCDSTNTYGGMDVTPTFYLNESCQVLTKVNDATQGNKAWTDRTWNGSNYSDMAYQGTNYPNQLPGPYLNYLFNQRNTPYGMSSQGLNNSGNLSSNPGKLWLIGDSFNTNPQSPLYNAGSAYSCLGNCGGRSCEGGTNNGGVCNTSADCPGDLGQNINPGICVGVGGAGNTQANGGISASGQGFVYAKQRLSSLFAKSYGAYVWNDALGAYIFSPPSDLNYNWDISNEKDLYGVNPASNDFHDSPFIFAVDGQTKARILNPYNVVSINGSYSSNNIEEHVTAMLPIQFYFYSDSTSMPTRKLKIDWGDGTPVFEQDGYFQNHLADNECCDQATTCTDFGRTPGACSESYYEASHLFGYALASDNYLCTNQGVNIPGAKCFKPRVQITDNWDWCNKSGYNGNNNECDDLINHSAEFAGWIVVYQQ